VPEANTIAVVLVLIVGGYLLSLQCAKCARALKLRVDGALETFDGVRQEMKAARVAITTIKDKTETIQSGAETALTWMELLYTAGLVFGIGRKIYDAYKTKGAKKESLDSEVSKGIDLVTFLLLIPSVYSLGFEGFIKLAVRLRTIMLTILTTIRGGLWVFGGLFKNKHAVDEAVGVAETAMHQGLGAANDAVNGKAPKEYMLGPDGEIATVALVAGSGGAGVGQAGKEDEKNPSPAMPVAKPVQPTMGFDAKAYAARANQSAKGAWDGLRKMWNKQEKKPLQGQAQVTREDGTVESIELHFGKATAEKKVMIALLLIAVLAIVVWLIKRKQDGKKDSEENSKEKKNYDQSGGSKRNRQNRRGIVDDTPAVSGPGVCDGCQRIFADCVCREHAHEPLMKADFGAATAVVSVPEAKAPVSVATAIMPQVPKAVSEVPAIASAPAKPQDALKFQKPKAHIKAAKKKAKLNDQQKKEAADKAAKDAARAKRDAPTTFGQKFLDGKLSRREVDAFKVVPCLYGEKCHNHQFNACPYKHAQKATPAQKAGVKLGTRERVLKEFAIELNGERSTELLDMTSVRELQECKGEALYGRKQYAIPRFVGKVLVTSAAGTSFVNCTFVKGNLPPNKFCVFVEHVLNVRNSGGEGGLATEFTVTFTDGSTEVFQTKNTLKLANDLRCVAIPQSKMATQEAAELRAPATSPEEVMYCGYTDSKAVEMRFSGGRFYDCFHNCATIPGNCSGPLIALDGKVIAFHQAALHSEKVNVGIPVGSSVKAVLQLN
jgi:hypothetical protein